MPAFRALRLDALQLHPEAFIPTYEEEVGRDSTAARSEQRDAWIQHGNMILGAFVDSHLVGAVGVMRWQRHKQRHKATIWLLYTAPSVRGQGIARRLLQSAIDHCRATPELEMIQLSVGTESSTARHLYERFGFICYGREPRALKLDDREIAVDHMVLDLSS